MKILLTILSVMLSLEVNATQQIPEEFEVDMARFRIEQQPLDSFISNEDFHKMFKPGVCSASWRGYKGSWALRGQKLVLTYLVTDACSKSPKSIDTNKLFGSKRYPVEATWYTGKIIVRIGERKFYDPAIVGYSGQEYEAVVYEFQSGKLISRSIETVEEKW